MGQETIELEVIDLDSGENQEKLNIEGVVRLVTKKCTFRSDEILAITTSSKYQLNIVPKGAKGNKKRYNLLFTKERKQPYLLKRPMAEIEALLSSDFGVYLSGTFLKVGVHLLVNSRYCNRPIEKDYKLLVDGIERPIRVSLAEMKSFNASWTKFRSDSTKSFGRQCMELGEAYEKSLNELPQEVIEARNRWMYKVANEMREGVEEYLAEKNK